MQGTLEMQVQALGGEELPQKGMATYSSILTCRSPWAEEAGGLQSMGSQTVGHTAEHAGTVASHGL